MNIISRQIIHRAVASGQCFLSTWECTIENNGVQSPYFFVTRGDELHAVKRPDAVIIIAFIKDGTDTKLVLTNEFRPPIGCRELGFPAGLIDTDDYFHTESAAIVAAKRELFEETGLDNFSAAEVSPNNLYSSAGMTNESCRIVMGCASGTLTTDNVEGNEDIEIMAVTQYDTTHIINNPRYSFGKTAWPFLWAFATNGFPYWAEGGTNNS
jgi:ADP-ribose pyrophosphatase